MHVTYLAINVPELGAVETQEKPAGNTQQTVCVVRLVHATCGQEWLKCAFKAEGLMTADDGLEREDDNRYPFEDIEERCPSLCTPSTHARLISAQRYALFGRKTPK